MRVATAFGVGVAAVAACGCATDGWDRASEAEVSDIDQHVHRKLRNAYLTDDLSKVLAFYRLEKGSPFEAEVTARRKAVMDRYSDIKYGVVSIRPPALFDTPAKDQATVAVRTTLHGDGKTGPLTYVEDATMVVSYEVPKDPKIVGETVQRTKWIERPPGKTFAEIAAAAGITMVADGVGVEIRSVVIPDIPLWYGGACGDYDGDGFEDLYLVNGKADRLYRNRGDGTFEDVTERAGLANTGDVGQGAVFGDFDNDGDADLFVVSLLGQSQTFRNEGNGTFTEVTADAGIPPTPFATSCALLDFDGDGLLDLFLVGGGNFADDTPTPIYEAVNGTKDHFFRNRGGLRFEDVSAKAGIDGPGWGLAVSCTDYDGDGDEDIFVANDFGLNDLWRNGGDGTFENVARQAGVEARGAGMGITWGDYDNDGDMDVYVSKMFSNSVWMFHHPDYPLPAAWWQRLLFKPFILDILHEMGQGSYLLRNEGDGTFKDVSDELDVRDAAQWAWGSTFVDYDCDGDLDLYVVNGFISGEQKDDL